MIPWSSDDRPLWLPHEGEPIDLETAALLVARYLPRVRAMLTEIAASVAGRTSGKLTTHLWTTQEIVAHWGSGAIDAILVGSVTVDERATGGTFRSVLVLISKEDGWIEARDHSGLLRG